MSYLMTATGWVNLGECRACSNSNNLEGVYRPEPIEKVQMELGARIRRFNEANGIQNMMLKQHHFSGHSFLDHGHPPLRGAFGELL